MSQMFIRSTLRRLCLFLLLATLIFASTAQYLGFLNPSASRPPDDSHVAVVARTGGRSLLTHHELVEPNTELVVDPYGTVILRHHSGRKIWSFSSGSPIHSSYQAPLDDTENATEYDSAFFMDYSDNGGQKLPVPFDDFLKNLPLVSDDGVMLGSKTSTAFLVDGRSGRLIHVYRSLDSTLNEYSSTSSMLKHGAEYTAELPLLITRTDSKLEQFGKISSKLLWNLTASHFRAALLCDPTLNSAHELGPEIYMGVYMPLLCGSQSDVRWLIKSEFVMRPLRDRPRNLPLPPQLKVEELPASMPSRIIHYAQSLVDKFLNPNQRNTVEASLILPSRKTKDSRRVPLQGSPKHYGGALSMLLEWPASFSNKVLIAVLLVIIIYYLVESTKYICASVAKEWLSLKGPSDSYMKATSSKKKKNRKSGKDKAGSERKDKHLSPGYDDGFEFTEGGSETPLILSRNASDGRRIGKLSVSNKEIAKGSNGTVVFEGIYEGRPVAVKRLVRSHHEVACKEIQNLIASDHHPNIVRWYGVEHDRDFIYLSLERCSCSLGDLIQSYSDSLLNVVAFDRDQTKKAPAEHKIQLDPLKGIMDDLELWKPSGYPSPLLLKLMRDVVSGLAHLHELGIIHRDLKPQNVLITKGRVVCAKLSDMGISKHLPGDMSSLGHLATGCGSSGWQAPEQLLDGRQTRAVDMFSLGCVIFFCITGGKHPFGNQLERDVNVVKNKMDLFVLEHIPEASDLILSLLNPDPELRPNAEDVLLHPLFWGSEMRLSFLRDASDRVELENREVGSDLLKAIESIAPVALGGKWDEKLEYVFITNIGQYRRYKFDSIRDLLRVIRNKLNHYRELPQDVQALVGPIPEGFNGYFSSRFPRLLIEVYRVIWSYCREEECFQKYFKCNFI